MNKELKTITAQDLLEKEFPDLFYAVDNMLPTGSAILAAPAKTGKSWMMLQLSIAVASGGYFMGRKCNKCHVLYLALEDSERRLSNRLLKSLNGRAIPEGLRFVTDAPIIGQGFIETIKKELEADPLLKLIIVDTLQKVKPPSNAKKTAYEQDYQLFGEISRTAKENDFCFVFLHHLRKTNGIKGDPFENILGSTALQGSTDTMMVMEREERTKSEATLHITGRDIEPQDLDIEFKNYQWESLGDHETVQRMRLEAEYNKNPAIITIKKKLAEIEADKSEPLKEYIVRAKDLRQDIVTETGQVIGTSEKNLMAIVKSYMPLLLQDGIQIIEPEPKKTTTYKNKQGRFYKIKRYKSK